MSAAEESPYPHEQAAASSTRRTAAALLLFMLTAPGCMVWAPLDAPALASETPDAVRVTTVDGSILTLTNSTVRNDSLVGVIEYSSVVAAVPLSDVAHVEMREESFGRSLGLLAGLAALGVLITFVLALRQI